MKAKNPWIMVFIFKLGNCLGCFSRFPYLWKWEASNLRTLPRDPLPPQFCWMTCTQMPMIRTGRSIVHKLMLFRTISIVSNYLPLCDRNRKWWRQFQVRGWRCWLTGRLPHRDFLPHRCIPSDVDLHWRQAEHQLQKQATPRCPSRVQFP